MNSNYKEFKVARIPVLGYVAAGIPIEEIEDVVDWEEIPKDWLRGGKKYFTCKNSSLYYHMLNLLYYFVFSCFINVFAVSTK